MFVNEINCPNCGAYSKIFASGTRHFTTNVVRDFTYKTLTGGDKISNGDPIVDLVKCHDCGKVWNNLSELAKDLKAKGEDIVTRAEFWNKITGWNKSTEQGEVK